MRGPRIRLNRRRLVTDEPSEATSGPRRLFAKALDPKQIASDSGGRWQINAEIPELAHHDCYSEARLRSRWFEWRLWCGRSVRNRDVSTDGRFAALGGLFFSGRFVGGDLLQLADLVAQFIQL